MPPSDNERFAALPPISLHDIARLKPGDKLALILLERTRSDAAVLFPLDWEHEALRETKDRETVGAVGAVRMQGTRKSVKAHLAFEPRTGRALLESDGLRGEVKAGEPRHASLADFLSDASH